MTLFQRPSQIPHKSLPISHVRLHRFATLPQAQEILESSNGAFSSPHVDGNFILNSPQPAAAFSVFPFARSQATTLEILARLPSRAQADAAARFYFMNTDWYMHMSELVLAIRETESCVRRYFERMEMELNPA